MKKIFSLSVFVSAFLSATLAQPGSLDLTFSQDGKVTTGIGTSYDYAQAVAVQADGKILAGGYTNVGLLNSDFALVRYNSNGSLDLTFGNSGIVTTDLGNSDDKPYAIVVQPDGKIVLAGTRYLSSAKDFAVVRYNSNGTLDNSFGTGGIVVTDLGSPLEEAYTMALQSDGKIVVAGEGRGGPNSDFALVRYTANGALDNTFGTGGIVLTDLANSYDIIYSICLQPDGKIIAVGDIDVGNGNDFAVARYNSNGTLDAGFGNSGYVATPIGSAEDEAYGVLLQPDGKIVVAGISNNGNDYDFALARYNSNGTLDAGFDSDGKTTTGVGVDDIAKAVVIQTDGKIIAGGFAYNGNNSDFALVRYNSNGSLDNAFDSDGKVMTDFSGTQDESYAMALQADGKILMAGASLVSNFDFALARYNASGPSGIPENNAGPVINLYPNPFSNELVLQGTGESGELLIADVTGKMIIRQKGTAGNTRVNTTSLAPGCYLLSYKEDERSVNIKLVKQ